MSLDNAILIKNLEERGLGERQREQLLTDKFISNQELQHKTKITKMELALKEEMEILRWICRYSEHTTCNIAFRNSCY